MKKFKKVKGGNVTGEKVAGEKVKENVAVFQFPCWGTTSLSSIPSNTEPV